MSFIPLKRGRKRIFNEEEAIRLANQGLTCQQIANELSIGNVIHYASIRHLLTSKKVSYSKGKIGRPSSNSQKERMNNDTT